MNPDAAPLDPEACGEAARLEENLAALTRAGSDLSVRMRWPARSSHVEPSGQGHWLRYGLRVSLEAAEVEPEPEPSPDSAPLLLLGVGLGEQVRALLEADSDRPEGTPPRRIFAYERDPWLLRLALRRNDFVTAIASGRLELGLGCDLARWLSSQAAFELRLHPRLGGIYRLEHALARRRALERVVAIGVDRLLVDSIGDALAASGYAAFPFDFAVWSIEELHHATSRLRPQLLFSVNHVHGLVEFCRERDLRYVCWEIDPTTEILDPIEGNTRHCSIWTYRRSHVSVFRRAGFTRVEHLPLAGDLARGRVQGHAPVSPAATPNVVFVGSSLAPESQRARAHWSHAFDERMSDPEATRRALALLDEITHAYALEPRLERLEEALRAAFGELVDAVRSLSGREDPVVLAAQMSAAVKRRSYVSALGRFGIHVWGDPGWQNLEGDGVRYRGFAGHHVELPEIYRGAAINLDIGRIYQSDIVTFRVFDVLACGGFLLAERSADLSELFALGDEVACYGSPEELLETVAQYLAAPRLRSTLAERGHAALRARHTVEHRVRRMLEALPGRAEDR